MRFDEFLRDIGLLPRSMEPGRWHRCPTDSHPSSNNGAYLLAEHRMIGWAMDWAIHTDPLMWRAEGDGPIIDKAEIARSKASVRRANELARREAEEFYRRCKPLQGNHPYLAAKGLSNEWCNVLRVDQDQNLVVPMYRNGLIISVQRISPNGEKKFWPGASVKCAALMLGVPGVTIVLCEGLATALTIKASDQSMSAACCFNAGNLPEVARRIVDDKWNFPSAIVAADNDHATDARIGRNPGVEKAREAAQILGCGVAIPTCKGTDWNDYMQESIATLKDKSPRSKPDQLRKAALRDVAMKIRSCKP